MFPQANPAKLAARFTALSEALAPVSTAARAEAGQRKLLQAIAAKAPATLNDVAAAVERGAPAVSRAVDGLVRAGLVERTPDPDNRRRLALRLTAQGQERLGQAHGPNPGLEEKFGRIPQSELRALERAIEILERLPR
jgi:DNA-binding MarR family transcriptional regulator